MLASLILGAIAVVGCSSIKSGSHKFANPFAPKPIPARIIAYWQPGVQNLPSGESKRGFTGRVYFHDNKTTIPLKADGMVYIYAYDEACPDPSKMEADFCITYTPEMLKDRYSKSDFGHSYSVWVPWINQGDEQQKVSLFVKYIPNNGSAILSEQACVYLPGKDNPILAAKDDPNINRLVSYQDSSIEDSRMIRQAGGLAENRIGGDENSLTERPITGYNQRPGSFMVKTIDSKGSNQWTNPAGNTMLADSRNIGTVQPQGEKDIQSRTYQAPQPISRASMAGNDTPELRERPREIEFESIQDTIARNLRNQPNSEPRNTYSNDSYANADNGNRRYEEPRTYREDRPRYYDEPAPRYTESYRESDIGQVRYREYEEEIPSYHSRVTGADYREPNGQYQRR